MKKIISLLISVVIILSSLAGICVSAEDATIFNWSFKDGMGEFKPFSVKSQEKTTLVKDDSLGRQVAYVLDDSTELGSGVRTPKIPVKAGRSYTASVNLKCVSGTIKVYVRYYDEAGKQLDNKSVAAKVGMYAVVPVNLPAPSNATDMEVLIATNSTLFGEAYVDSVTVTEGAEMKVEASITKVKENPDKNVRRFSAKDSTENFKIKGIETGVDVKDDLMCSSAIPTSYIEVVPETPIAVDNLNMKIKYRMKAKGTAKISYLGLYMYGEGGKLGTGLYLVSFPTSDKWYEGEIELMDAGAIGSRGLFEAGDTIESFRMAVGNNSGQNVEGYFDYVEFVAGQEDMWGTPAGQDVIDDVARKVSAAKPGDTIIIPNGTYTGVKMEFKGMGQEGKPVTIKAETPGQVIINGLSYLTVDGEYLTVDGLYFKGAWSPTIISYKGSSRNCRLTNTALVDCNSPNRKTKNVWVEVGGQYNRVDHCFLNKKNNHGVLFSMVRTDQPNYFTIDHNYFGNFEPSVVGNGAETIRAGSGAASYVPSESVLEKNFFEKCDGEGELISLKAAKTIVRYNTVYNSAGGLCLRAGDDNKVYGNLFYKTTGVRVIGVNQEVRDNYILQPSDAGLALESGTDPNDAQYTPVKNALINDNTFDSCSVATIVNAGETAQSNIASVAYPRKYPPEGAYNNNLIISYNETPQISVNNKAPDFKFGKNAQICGVGSDVGNLTTGVTAKRSTKGYLYSEEGYGADVSELENAPLDPREFLCDWMLKKVNDNEDGFVIGKVALSAGSEDEIGILLNGERLVSDVAPTEISGRTLVPLRAIFEAMYATVSWDEATATATAQRGDIKISLTENETTALVNDKPYILDVPATIINGRFVVPVRFISETLGAKVDWIDGTKTVVITGGTVKFKPNPAVAGSLGIFEAIQSGDDGTGKTVVNVLDGNISTKWGVLYNPEVPDSAHAIFDLGSSMDIGSVHISFSAGDSRNYYFDIYVSDDNESFTLVSKDCASGGKTTDFEEFPVKAKGRYLKITGRGNSTNNWMTINELAISK